MCVWYDIYIAVYIQTHIYQYRHIVAFYMSQQECEAHIPNKAWQRHKDSVEIEAAKHAGMTHRAPYQTENVCSNPPSYPDSQVTLAVFMDTTTRTLEGACGLVPT